MLRNKQFILCSQGMQYVYLIFDNKVQYFAVFNLLLSYSVTCFIYEQTCRTFIILKYIYLVSLHPVIVIQNNTKVYTQIVFLNSFSVTGLHDKLYNIVEKRLRQQCWIPYSLGINISTAGIQFAQNGTPASMGGTKIAAQTPAHYIICTCNNTFFIND